MPHLKKKDDDQNSSIEDQNVSIGKGSIDDFEAWLPREYLVKLWKHIAPRVDAIKPDASPKSETGSEKARIRDYFHFYHWLTNKWPKLQSRWDALIDKFTEKYHEDNTRARYPWYENLKTDERNEWTKELARAALMLGLNLDYILTEVYDCTRNGMPFVVRMWEEAEKDIKRERELELLCDKDEEKALESFDKSIGKR